jgi:hypothetical protein
MKRLAGRKVENISKVVKQLEEEVFDAYDMFDDVLFAFTFPYLPTWYLLHIYQSMFSQWL